MSASVLSVNAGRLAPVEGMRRPSGIHKQPVDRIEVRDPGPKHGGLGSGVVGDAIGSRKHHGGETQAVYAVAREELDWWGRELGRDLPAGVFGENLTTLGLDVDAAELGERWRVGLTLLEVCGPRVPCATFAKHMAEPRWVRRFTEHGLTGAYLAVREAGWIERDDPIEVVHRPGHGLTVPMYFRAVMGDRDLAEAILDARVLPEVEHEWLAGRR
ncbi:MOSC domain-containing protein YiiM [Nocardioides exalbidus]|uniref:MOSC domain-containing protein YiiM n=1 Tax=Nocardioides exalbidus TaxID=402596 RepID=A0A1H4TQP8_9ACTN|nr:MOSC domain-containing protein [Nocardioides exalbidus]SEC58775.1 MOSC domain-containing protein YiiM [Nocardioides exalbidus]